MMLNALRVCDSEHPAVVCVCFFQGQSNISNMHQPQDYTFELQRRVLRGSGRSVL